MEKQWRFNREKLVKMVEKEGISRYEFAKRSGIDDSVAYRYFKGINEPNKFNLMKIANYFGVSVDEFKMNADRKADMDIERDIANHHIKKNMAKPKKVLLEHEIADFISNMKNMEVAAIAKVDVGFGNLYTVFDMKGM